MIAKELRILASAFVLLLFISCLGSDSNTSSSGGPFSEKSSQPIAEAFIEYPGPHERWAGPQNFVVHLNARGSEEAQVSVRPDWYPSGNRAHDGKKAAASGHRHGMSVDVAKEQLARLYTALQGKDQAYSGCLLTVRVRLIRSDGVLMERQACRSQSGWPRVASEVVSHLIEAIAGSHGGKEDPKTAG